MPAPDWQVYGIMKTPIDIVVTPPIDPTTGHPLDPTSYVTQVACLTTAQAQPGPSDWVTVQWRLEPAAVPGGQPTYVTYAVIGNGAQIPLARARYYVWCQITVGTTILPGTKVGILDVL